MKERTNENYRRGETTSVRRKLSWQRVVSGQLIKSFVSIASFYKLLRINAFLYLTGNVVVFEQIISHGDS